MDARLPLVFASFRQVSGPRPRQAWPCDWFEGDPPGGDLSSGTRRDTPAAVEPRGGGRPRRFDRIHHVVEVF